MDSHEPNKEPIKGILKHHDEELEAGDHPKREMKWDEMNIIATHHPADKDYGHMKIDEPKTPFSHLHGGGSGDEEDPSVMLAKAAKALEQSGSGKAGSPKVLRRASFSDQDHDQMHDADLDSDDERFDNLPPEEKKKHEEFRKKRRMHYNEGQRLKEAKKLLEREGYGTDDETEHNTEINEVLTAPPSRHH